MNQNVSDTEQTGQSAHLSTAYSHHASLHCLPLITDTSEPMETPTTHTVCFYKEREVTQYLSSNCVSSFFLYISQNLTHIPHIRPRKSTAFVKHSKESTSVFSQMPRFNTETIWKVCTRPSLFLRPVKMHVEMLLKGGKPSCLNCG